MNSFILSYELQNYTSENYFSANLEKTEDSYKIQEFRFNRLHHILQDPPNWPL